MGFSFGKSSSKGVSGQSATQRHASNILLEAILPGSSMTGGYISDQTPSGTIPTSRAAGGSNQDTGMGMRIGAPNLGPRPHKATIQAPRGELPQGQYLKGQTLDPNEYNLNILEGDRPLRPGEDPTKYFYDSIQPGGNTPAVVPPGYVLTQRGQVVPRPGGEADPGSMVPVLYGSGTSGDPMANVVSRKVGNYVPSAKQQGFGALMGHGMTEAYRQQVGPYTDVQGQGRVASTNPLTQGQADAVTKTLLPSLEQMRYKGAFERFDKGTLTPTAAGVIEAGSKIASDPLGQAQAAAAQIDEAILGGNIPQLPELPEITTYVEDVYNKMPDPLKNVITDLMSGGVTANIQASLEANVQAYANQANLALTDMLDETYGRFASSGVSGGAMLAAAGDVTTKVMADVAGNIANFYQQAMTTVQQERQLALQTVESLIGTAQQQQAMDFQGQTINLESTLKIAEQKYAMYTQLTNQFLDQNLAYTNIIAQEIDRENTESINNMRMYYEILVSLATGGPALSTERSKSTKFSVTKTPTYTNPLDTGTGTGQGNMVQNIAKTGRS